MVAISKEWDNRIEDLMRHLQYLKKICDTLIEYLLICIF